MDVLKLKESSACSSLAKKHGEGHLPAKENSDSRHNCALSAGHFHSSTLSTPIKTYCGLQASLQTPASKLAFSSASGQNQQQPIGAGQKTSEDVIITRTPLRLLAANNKNTSLLSPSPLKRLGSPAFLGKARRVFVMPPELLLTPRRVPVKQKSSETTNANWQSPYFTPKKPPFATPTSNKALETACQKNDGHHHDAFQWKKDLSEPQRVFACTPRPTPVSTSSTAGHVLDATCQKHDAKVENSAFPKRMLAFTHPQSPCTTPISRRKDTSALTKNGIASDSISKQRCITVLRDDDIRLDRLALLKRLLATTPARRVPIRQKPKEPSNKVSSQHNENKPSKSFSETPKACKTGQSKVRMSGNARSKSTGKAKQRSDAGVDEEGADTTKQECDDGVDEMHDAHKEGTDEKNGDGANEISVGESKQHDASEQGTKQQIGDGDGDGVDEMRVHESKEHDPKGGTDHVKEQPDDVVHEMSVGVSMQHDGAECTDNMNSTKDVKRRRAIKDNSSAKVNNCNQKKPSRKLFPSVAPHGKADVNRCKGTKPSDKLAFSLTPIRSTNVKKCEEKKPKKKASSLEALKGCKASQTRTQTCQNHGTTKGSIPKQHNASV